MVIWNLDGRQKVSPRFSDAAEIIEISPAGGDSVCVVMKKTISGEVV